LGIDLAHAAVIPEPSACVLALLGLLAVGLSGRRRRRASRA
jgi:MYXO-CTERM domain-containing protein